MKPIPEKLPPAPDDFVIFRTAIRKAPPLFLAILIVLGLGAILARLAFFTFEPMEERGVFINLQGAIEAGEEAAGEDEEEGAKGEKEEEEATEPEVSESESMDAPLEPDQWLDRIPRPAPMGPKATPAPAPPKKKSPGKMRVPGRKGGGRGSKGMGRGSGSPWGKRSGTGRGDGVRKWGGTAASESAVEAGLSWLRRHQADNGAWRADGFGAQCLAGKACGGEALKGVNYDAGATALSLMAFLGGGYTHLEGRFKRTVQRGLGYLQAIQSPEGRFGSESMYAQSLSVIALAEAYGMSSDIELLLPLKRGTNFLVRAQQARGGWTYDPSPRRERNDSSITAFAVMALKAARAADIFVPESALNGARRHFLRATKQNGDVWYADAPPGWDRRGVGMIAAGVFVSFLLGRPLDHPIIPKQLAKLRASRPLWGDKRDL
ncbi:MAG: prenyltransferase/squalene oxidase repeat-containing protein, partial [Planctomycetota bacterium]